MTIRSGRSPNPQHACHSADVLTPTERAAAQHDKPFVHPAEIVYRDKAMRWGDIPEIRQLLESLRGPSCT